MYETLPSPFLPFFFFRLLRKLLPEVAAAQRIASKQASSTQRLRSYSFLTRNEKRCERNKRAVSNLFTEAAGVGQRLVFGEQNETREEGNVGKKRKR